MSFRGRTILLNALAAGAVIWLVWWFFVYPA